MVENERHTRGMRRSSRRGTTREDVEKGILKQHTLTRMTNHGALEPLSTAMSQSTYLLTTTRWFVRVATPAPQRPEKAHPPLPPTLLFSDEAKMKLPRRILCHLQEEL